MLEIFLLLGTLLALANYKGKPRRRYSLRGVKVTPQFALGTLATQIVLTAPLVGTSDAQYRLVSASASWSLRSFTPGEGAITVGYAHNDYTITEIKEYLESATSISPGNKVLQEQANRWIRVVGTFKAEANNVLNEGLPVKTRLNWAIQIGSAVNVFAYNENSSALTTGSVIDMVGKIWVKDY